MDSVASLSSRGQRFVARGRVVSFEFQFVNLQAFVIVNVHCDVHPAYQWLRTPHCAARGARALDARVGRGALASS